MADTESVPEQGGDVQPPWSPEPWRYANTSGDIYDTHGCYIGSIFDCDHVPEDGTDRGVNGERIAACVNALAGIPTEALRQGVVRLMIEALRRLQIENPGDFVYEVRNRELLGWEGPRVRSWGEGCNRLDEALALLPAALVAEIVPPLLAEKEDSDG